MPYIPKKDRARYDGLIDDLSILLSVLDNDELSGHMNYVLFRLAGRLCGPISSGDRNFARMAVIRSALLETHDEFRRRIMNLYEDEKIESNGDVKF